LIKYIISPGDASLKTPLIRASMKNDHFYDLKSFSRDKLSALTNNDGVKRLLIYSPSRRITIIYEVFNNP
jgi:hypothetical protein